MEKTKSKKQEREEIKQFDLDYLRKNLTPGSTVTTVLKHVSKSGMSRVIQCMAIINGEIQDISGLVCGVLDKKYNQKYGGVQVGGCGMDMGFHLVYSLSYRLYPKGYKCIGENCPANDHHNKPYPDRDGSMWHTDGGYVINQKW